MTLVRTGAGRYELDIPAVAPVGTSDIAVTAVGSTAGCAVTSTVGLANGAQAVRISCTAR